MGAARRVLVFHDYEAMAAFLLEKWREISSDAVLKKGTFSVALSGGKTPRGFYRKLAGQGGDLPWDKTHIFLVDERFVPETDSDSNYRMIREMLLDDVPLPPAHVHPIPTGGNDPSFAAHKYEEELAGFFGLSSGTLPVFDLIVLGIGKDGHTASLFPGGTLLLATRRLAGAAPQGPATHDRISLTLPVLNNAMHVVFLVTGKEKAETLRDVVEKNDPRLPAARVIPGRGNLVILADGDAASLLSEKVYEKR